MPGFQILLPLLQEVHMVPAEDRCSAQVILPHILHEVKDGFPQMWQSPSRFNSALPRG
jgi:hypothetical protein